MICTSIKQSKKFIELGIPKNTADMRIGNYVGKSGKVDGTNVHYYTKEESFGAPEIIPAWSLSALERLMPFQIIKNNERFGFYQVKGFNKQGETYRFGYKTNNDSFLFETSWYNDVIDAAFEMVVWLKENNKI